MLKQNKTIHYRKSRTLGSKSKPQSETINK